MNCDWDILDCTKGGTCGTAICRYRFAKLLLSGGLLILLLTAAGTTRAANPPASSAQLSVLQARLKLVVTMSPDAARDLIAAANLPADAVQALNPVPPLLPCDLPEQAATNIFELSANGATLAAEKVSLNTEGDQVLFTIVYPRPENGTVSAKAVYLKNSGKNNSFIARDENQELLSAAMLSGDRNSIRFQLPAQPALDSTTAKWQTPEEPTDALGDDEMDVAAIATPTPAPPPAPIPAPSFGQFVRLGAENLLTSLEHLVFLALLLLGTRKILPMLGVIACFTAAQSISLALSVTGMWTMPPGWIEPLIIVSILAAAADNLWRRNAIADRFWLAAGFGLVHGFDFANALHESSVELTLPMSLVPFNIGLTLGQIAVAAVAISFLLMLRRVPAFTRIRSAQ